jgi:flavin reductase (DIM6/NTAB) family NADH-FMN oxidoreductase RutF
MSDRKKVLRMIPHGLQVVTVREGEEVYGYTSSWLTQGSFEPPLVVLGLRKESTSGRMLLASGVFCVHFLGKEQKELAQHFFKSAHHSGEKLAGLEHHPGERTGCPVLEDVLGHAECRVVHVYEGGDHNVVIAEVLLAKLHREGEPLTMADTPWQYGG